MLDTLESDPDVWSVSRYDYGPCAESVEGKVSSLRDQVMRRLRAELLTDEQEPLCKCGLLRSAHYHGVDEAGWHPFSSRGV